MRSQDSHMFIYECTYSLYTYCNIYTYIYIFCVCFFSLFSICKLIRYLLLWSKNKLMQSKSPGKITHDPHSWQKWWSQITRQCYRLRQVAETAAFGNPFQTGRTSSKKDCLVGRFLLRFTLILCLSRCSFGLRFGIKICNVCMYDSFFIGIFTLKSFIWKFLHSLFCWTFQTDSKF